MCIRDSRYRWTDRQHNLDNQPIGWIIFQPDFTHMHLNKTPAYGQPQAHALIIAGKTWIYLLKWIKNFFFKFVFYSNTMINYADRVGGFINGAEPNADFFIFRSEFDRI